MTTTQITNMLDGMVAYMISNTTSGVTTEASDMNTAIGERRDYFLRTCGPDGFSQGGYRWPLAVGAEAEAPDWDPNRPEGGLHGILSGVGCAGGGHLDAALLCFANDSSLRPMTTDLVFVVFSASAGTAVHMHTGESKVRYARVEYVGTCAGAAAFLVAHGADLTMCIGYTAAGGDGVRLVGGYRSSLTGGFGATLFGGYRSTLVGGVESVLIGGDYATLTGGDSSTLTGGKYSRLSGGKDSTLTGGEKSIFRGGSGTSFAAKWWDEDNYRHSITVGYVGRTGCGGIEENRAYRLDIYGEFAAVDEIAEART